MIGTPAGVAFTLSIPMRMLLGLSGGLPNLVEAKFNAARAASSLLLSPTELAIVQTTTGIPFQLRFCPALARKPTLEQVDTAPGNRVDPFDNPPAALHVIDVPTSDPTHLLVLNKFPIIANHFILATKSNKKQTHVLEQDDLEATYACLKAWQEGPGADRRRLFAFFNSGLHSGASQPHRHLQFLPLEDMRGKEEANSWDLLVDLVLSGTGVQAKDAPSGTIQHPSLPVTHFAKSFDSEPSGHQLHSIYNALYSSAKEAVDKYIAANPGQLALHPVTGGDLPISYNLALTTAGMVILPRRAEGIMLQRDDGSEVGFVALNGTTLGGTMMVKHQEEWDLLRSKPEMLDQILAAIGVPQEAVWSKSRV